MTAWGGKRTGAGRPKGSKIAAVCEALKISPYQLRQSQRLRGICDLLGDQKLVQKVMAGEMKLPKALRLAEDRLALKIVSAEVEEARSGKKSRDSAV